jgi:hypothetical protein
MRKEKKLMSMESRTIRRLVSAFVVAGLVLGAAVLVVGIAPGVKACITPSGCDFLTGGGWIVYKGNKATFGVGGGCKFGSPTWGHLEYQDHGMGLNVHGTGVTAYMDAGGDGTDPKTGQPIGIRDICGTARTNLYGDVFYHVQARDFGEPGVNDTFDIRLKRCDSSGNNCGGYLYDTTNQCFPHYLGSYTPCAPGSGGGGNIQLHKPNASTTGSFGGSCPAF